MPIQLNEYIKNLDQFVTALNSDMGEIMLSAGVQAKSDIQERIQERGLDDQDNPLKYGSGTPYSEKDVPAFFYDTKDALNAGGVGLIEESLENGDGISYADWREANGLQTDHVDLTFTGRMWQNIGIRNLKTGQNIAIVQIGGKNDESQNKLNWNSQRYGDLMKLSTDDRQNVNIIIDARIQNLANKYL